MLIENKLDNSFGKTGTIAGFILLVFGLFLIRTVSGIIIILLGAFLAFSHSGTLIDTEKRTIHIYSKILGLFKTGSIKNLDNYTLLKVYHNKRTDNTYSQGNRKLTIEENDFRVFLINPSKNERVAVKKCPTQEEAVNEAKMLSQIINIPFME